VGRLAHRLHQQQAAQHSEADCHPTSSGGSATDVTPSAATGAAVEPLRAHQRFSAARHRAWRMTGVTIWQARSKQSAAACAKRRSVRQAGSFTHRVKESSLRSPGTGTGRCCKPAGKAGPIRQLGLAMKAQP